MGATRFGTLELEAITAARTGERMIEPGAESGPTTGGPSVAVASMVPPWLSNLASLSWRILAVLGVIVVAWLVITVLWTVAAAIAVAVVISAVLAPFVLRLRAQGRSRTASAGIVWLVAVVVSIGLIAFLALAFLPFAVDVVTRITTGIDTLEAELAALDVPQWVSALASDVIARMQTGVGDAVGDIAGAAASAATILILAAFLVFFFLSDGDKGWLWAFQSLPDEKLELITTSSDEALTRVGGYLRGTTVLALIIAASNYVFMLVLGVPLAVPLAILSFVATYIPYFGGLGSTIVIALVSLGSLGVGPTIVLLVLMGARGVALSYLVRPAVYGRTVNIHPALVLIVLPLGFQLGGVVGLFAAVPIVAVVMTVAQATMTIIDPKPAPPLPGLVPAWLDRTAQWSWRALLVFGLIAALVFLLTAVPLVVLPILLAFILAATLHPVVVWLIERGWHRGSATAMAVGGTAFAIGGVLILTMTSLVTQISELNDTVVSGAASVDDAADGHLAIGSEAITIGGTATLNAVVSFASNIAAVGLIVILSVLLTFYLLRDGPGLWVRATRRAHSSTAGELAAAGSRAFSVLGGYMIGTAAISFVGAASQFAIMIVLGLPLALPVFVLSFFLAFIPYIGGLITTLIAFFIAVQVGEPIDILVMFIWTIVFNLVQGNIVSPIVYGRTVHIHPAVALLAIPAGGAVAGLLGMFVVVPAIGVVAATWRTVLAVMGNQPAVRDGTAKVGSDADDDQSTRGHDGASVDAVDASPAPS